MSEKATLVQKLISVYEKVDHIEKRGKNKQGEGYKYIRATDLAHAIRKALLELNVYAEVNFTNERQYTIARGGDKEGKSPFAANDVRCTIVFHDGDSNEVLTSSGLGTGADMSDKAIYKAQTGALKNTLRNAFIIPDESDPEADEDVDRAAEDSKTEVSRPKGPVKSEIPNGSAAVTNSTTKVVNQKTASAPSTTTSTSAAPDASTGAFPTPEELDGFRIRFGKLVDALSTAGLKSSKGFPLQKKVLAYLLKTTGVDSAEKISKNSWDTFFTESGRIVTGEGGIKQLVEEVNSVVEEKA